MPIFEIFSIFKILPCFTIFCPIFKICFIFKMGTYFQIVDLFQKCLPIFKIHAGILADLSKLWITSRQNGPLSNSEFSRNFFRTWSQVEEFLTFLMYRVLLENWEPSLVAHKNNKTQIHSESNHQPTSQKKWVFLDIFFVLENVQFDDKDFFENWCLHDFDFNIRLMSQT